VRVEIYWSRNSGNWYLYTVPKSIRKTRVHMRYLIGWPMSSVPKDVKEMIAVMDIAHPGKSQWGHKFGRPADDIGWAYAIEGKGLVRVKRILAEIEHKKQKLVRLNARRRQPEEG
jgi:hypothetical protein